MRRPIPPWLIAGTCSLALLSAPLAGAAVTSAPANPPAAAASAPQSGAAAPANAAPAAGSANGGAASAPAAGAPAPAAGPAKTAVPATGGPPAAAAVPVPPSPIAMANAVVVQAPAAARPSSAPQRPARAPSNVAPALNVVGEPSQTMQLEMQHGELIRLAHPAANVFVADPNVANVQVKSPTVIYVFGIAAGDTNIYALDDNDAVLLNVGIQVTHDLSRLKQTLAQAVPDADIKVTTSGSSLMLSGVVRSPGQADEIKRIAGRFVTDDKQLINQVTVDAPTQVNLRVRFAEISRDVEKQFGINWSNSFKIGSFIGALATGNPVLASQLAAAPGQPSFFAPQSAPSTTLAGSISSGHGSDLNYLINALETENLASVLAEPNLTALSGETASFLAGGEFPIPTVQSGSGANAISVSFKTYGVQLAFTPTILESGRISLRVRPEVSQLTSQGAVTIDSITVDALTTRRADTTVELGSGQSLALAGLLQHNINESVNKFPWLGDIPVIGALLRSENFQRNETELVIVVTPYIVRPASDRKLALPTDGFYAPNDIDRIIGGQFFKRQLPPGSQATVLPNGATHLIGPVGFEME